MKKICAIFAVLTAVALTGCELGGNSDSSENSSVNNSSESSTSTESSSDSSSESSAQSSNESVKEPPTGDSFLIGLDGNAIPWEDITEADGTPLSELTPETQCTITVNGTYVGMPTKICRTNLDNPDVFDSEEFVFTDFPMTERTDYVRVKEGEELCGLKVKTAVSNFMGDRFSYGSLELEGEVGLTGYICIMADNVYGVGLVGDIVFIPSDCEVNLPILGYIKFSPDEEIHYLTGRPAFQTDNGQLYYANELNQNQLDLGKFTSVTADISDIPRDGSFVKVNIIVDNIKMSDAPGWTPSCSAELVDVELF